MYLGNQPALAYTSFAKQDFTTSATTNYVLDQAVTNANEIALFINFVRQEPTTAYTASGTTLTLTSATTAGDDMYCIFLGKALQTVNPPAGSVGASQITDGSITSAKLASGVGGKVLQVVQGSTSTQTSNNTTSYTDTTLSASITPSSTSSKVLVMLTQKLFLATGTSDRGSVKAKLVRGATDIWENATIYFQTTGISGEIDRYVCVNYLDTPSTTSSTTYKTQFAIDSTATNKIAYAQYGSTLAYITLMEIAG